MEQQLKRLGARHRFLLLLLLLLLLLRVVKHYGFNQGPPERYKITLLLWVALCCSVLLCVAVH
jgi:hypothetical protein